MRHQPEDVAALVRDAGDGSRGSVRVVAVVAQDDLAVRLELVEQLVIRVEAALSVLDRDDEPLADSAPAGEGRVRPLDADRDVPADESQRLVRAQRSRQQAGFAEDLEAIADPEDETPS